MKRGNQRRLAVIGSPEQPSYALLHFSRGFIRKRHRKDCRTGYAGRRNQVRNALRDDARLPAASAGEDQQRTFDVRGGLLLLGV